MQMQETWIRPMGELGWCNPLSCTLYYRVHATAQEAFRRPVIPPGGGCLEEEEEGGRKAGQGFLAGSARPLVFS